MLAIQTIHDIPNKEVNGIFISKLANYLNKILWITIFVKVGTSFRWLLRKKPDMFCIYSAKAQMPVINNKIIMHLLLGF